MDYWMRWLRAAGIRALKTFCQTAVATVGVSAALSEVDWFYVFECALLSGLLSVLTSAAGLPEVDGEE